MTPKKKKKKKRLRLKEGFKRFLVYSIVIILLLIYTGVQLHKIHDILEYHKTYEYKMTQKGFPLEEAKTLISKIKENDIEEILKDEEYKDVYYKIVTQKYFILKNYHKYLDYHKEHENVPYDELITIVNVHADVDPYTDVKETNTNMGYAILVNKYNFINEDYKPVDLVIINQDYSWGTLGSQKIRQEAYDAFIKMHEAAQQAGFYLMVNSSYREFADQKRIYKGNDETVARPGFSEHQTGLALDIFSLKHSNQNTFAQTEEYQWLIANSYKYGFILRYPEGKEKITGYNFESWHYRYVGVDLAKKVYDSGLTYDEYYAYYLEK